MKLQLSYSFYDLPLKDAFTISRYTVTVQRTVIVAVSDGTTTGYGEATLNPYYGSTEERITASLAKAGAIIKAFAAGHPEELWRLLEPGLRADYFSLCAVDNAYWDFYARINNTPLRSYFSTSESAPFTSYTIGIAPIEVMKEKILQKPWPLYKIKLGTPDDIAIVAELRKITDSSFRIDANGAWTADQAIENSKIFALMDVEFIEQPLAAGNIEGMKKVYDESALPVIADESCQRLQDVAACDGLFHGINIKLMKCGGITPAVEMIAKAREAGLKVMAGCMTESTVGISSLVQIAPLLDYLDADGALLLNRDIADGARFENGKILYSNYPGTGAELTAK